MLAAVQPIDHHADRQPREKTYPIQNWQPSHQQKARENRHYGRNRASRGAEPTRPRRITITQNKDSTCDQGKSKQSADVRKVSKRSDVEHAGRNPNNKPCNPRGYVRSTEANMDATEYLWQQAVSRHGKPDAGLAQLENQQRRNHSHQSAAKNCQAHPRYVELSQYVDDRSGVAKRVPVGNAGKNHHYRHVQQSTNEQSCNNADG